MIAQIINWSLKNRFLILVGTFFIFAFGIYVLKHTAVDAIPDLSDVQVIVKTSYPGQAPQVVEDQVTYPLTTAMLSVPGAVTVRGYSFFNDSYVYVIFEDGTDLYWARSRVLEYLSQVASSLPPSAKPELGPDATGVGWIYEYALVDKTGQHDLSQLTSLQNWFLKFELQTVPGVSEVATIGGMVKQYQITLEPNRLRTYGLTLEQVKKAIQNANQEVGGSVIELGGSEHMIRASGYIQNIQAIKDIPLGVNKNGTPILLSNLAEITLGPQERRGIAELNGQGEVVGGVIVIRFGGNALKTIQGVKAKLHDLQKSLPKGVEIVETYNRSGLILRAIHSLQSKLIEESIMVTLICLVFLFHLRSSLIIIISLPIGILGAFILMYSQGMNANIMSLGGIAIAIGAMVDATIVMIENVHKHFEKEIITDENRWEIIRKSAMQVGPPLFFSLLIITLSFLPVFGLQAQEGRLFAPLAFTKTYSMAVAAGLSITLVPVLMGYFIRGKILPEQKNPVNRALTAAYRPVIHYILQFPKSILGLALVLMIVSIWPYMHLGSEFMPNLDEGDWVYMPSMLPSVSTGQARQVLQQTDKLIMSVPGVKTVFGKVGRAESATDPAPLTMVESVIQFKPKSEWPKDMTIEKIKAKLRQRLQVPGLTNAWVMPIKNRIDMLATGIKTPAGIKISGPDLSVLQKIGGDIEKILKKVPGTESVYSEHAFGGRYVNIDIDRKAAARFGLNISDIDEVVRTAIGGMDITQTIEGLERYPVNLRYPQYERDSLTKLKALPIVTPTGAQIPLVDVAKVYVADGPPVIKSEDARVASWVLIDINDSDLGGYIDKAKLALQQQLKLPSGYSLTWTGQYQYMQRAKARLQILIPITLGIIILLLYLYFRRAPEVLIILGTLPFAFIGGVWLLYFLNYNLSVAVAVGFIALGGVAVEIGVVMLVYLNEAFEEQKLLAEEEKRALSLENIKQSVINGALLRLRPILMTVSAIIGGLLPIMLLSGTGIEVTRRIAAPMIGGMMSATVLTLLVIPATFLLWKSATSHLGASPLKYRLKDK
ncbi:MAG: CusA/CzcA family heavy metal efflux RND transporter [Candidatus Aquirickettsiella sp.]